MGYRTPPKEYQFKKGQSGNPKGKPVGTLSITKRFREALMKFETDKKGAKVELVEALVRAGIKKALLGDVSMIKLIWSYMDGMPRIQADIHAEEKISPFTDRQLYRIAKRAVAKYDGKD